MTGPTVRSSTKVMGAARAPARNMSASSEDSAGLVEARNLELCSAQRGLNHRRG